MGNVRGKKSPNRKISNNGFTLVELLVVIAIIALLLSILMPSLTKAREQARNAVCKSQIRSVVLGATLYAMDNNKRFPSTWEYGGLTGHDEIFGDINGNGIYEPSEHNGAARIYIDGYLSDGVSLKIAWCPNRKGSRTVNDIGHPRFGLDTWKKVRRNAGIAGLQVMGAYVYRNSKTGFTGKTTDNTKAWMADLGFWVKVHWSMSYYDRGQNHETGYNVGYTDGSVSWYSDPQNILSNGSVNMLGRLTDYGTVAWPLFDQRR